MRADESPILDSEELAAELKVPKATLDQWAYRRVGPAFIRIGKHRRYRRVDVERWLDANTTSPDAA
jgi:helix-turn-helix protein